MIKSDIERLQELFVEHSQVSIANIEDYLAENDMKMVAILANKIAKDATTVDLINIIEVANKLEIAADQKQKMKCLTLFTTLEQRLENEYEKIQVIA